MQSGKETAEPSPQGASGCYSCGGGGGPEHKEDRHGRESAPRLMGMHCADLLRRLSSPNIKTLTLPGGAISHGWAVSHVTETQALGCRYTVG